MFCVSVKVKITVLLCVVCILSVKAIPEMTYTVSGGMLNPTHPIPDHFDSLLIYSLAG